MTRAIGLFAVLLGLGCSHGVRQPRASTTQPTVGARVTLRGVAENWKAGAFLAGPDIWVDLPGMHWPDEVVGKLVEVKGTVVERHDLPVFIDDPNEPAVAGIPVPPGTDLHGASRRVILERVEWKVVRDGR